MGEMSYQPPLRGAILFAISLHGGAVSVDTLAEIAQVSPLRAKAYCSILAASRAIVENDQGFIAGPGWQKWAGKPTRSRPHKTTDSQSMAVMDEMRRAISQRVKLETASRGWSLTELARRSGVHHQLVFRLVRRCMPPPACHLILIARALDQTVEALVSPLPASTAHFHR